MNHTLLSEILAPHRLEPVPAYLLRPARYVEPTDPTHDDVLTRAARQVRQAYLAGQAKLSGERYHTEAWATNALSFEFLRDLEDDTELAIALTVFKRAGLTDCGHLRPATPEARQEMYERTVGAARYLRQLLDADMLVDAATPAARARVVERQLAPMLAGQQALALH